MGLFGFRRDIENRVKDLESWEKSLTDIRREEYFEFLKLKGKIYQCEAGLELLEGLQEENLQNKSSKADWIREVNDEFLQAAFKRQIMKCITKERYRAGIFTLSVKMLGVGNIIRRIIDLPSINEHVKRCVFSPKDLEVYFYNDSYLKFVLPSDSSRGNKFNDVIVDSSIDTDIKDNICRPCLLPYYPDINDLKCEKSIYLECEV